MLSDQPLQHLRHLDNDIIQIDDTGLQDLLATKGQKLAGQPRRLLRGFLDAQEIAAGRIVAVTALQ